MSLKISMFSIGLFFFTHTLVSAIDIETNKKTIIDILNRNNPTVVSECITLFQRYDQVVISLFDHSNKQSLKKHIEHMEQEIGLLNGIINDIRFKSIRSILITLHTEILEMVSVLKQYIGSRNTISLALKVRRFEFLLPSTIKQRGLFSLFQSLQHRLTCCN